jgi:ABC-type transport system involved in multi-copper enzyme maturation permease subunit
LSVFADNPVLRREVRRRLRIRFAGRPWMPGMLVVAGVVCWCYAIGISAVSGMSQDDAAVWWGVTIYGLMFLICLFAPAGSAKSITQERERQTWEALALTRLSAAQVLLGKWLAHVAAFSLLPLVLLPLALTASNGGIGVTVAVYAYIMLNCAFFVALGLVCSFVVSRSPVATVLAILCSAAIGLGTLIIDGLINWSASSFGSDGGPVAFALNVNPFYALMCVDHLARGNYDTSDVEAVVVSVGFELVFMFFSFVLMASSYGKPADR